MHVGRSEAPFNAGATTRECGTQPPEIQSTSRPKICLQGGMTDGDLEELCGVDSFSPMCPQLNSDYSRFVLII